MEDDKAIPPPTHAWQALIVEDMVWEGSDWPNGSHSDWLRLGCSVL